MTLSARNRLLGISIIISLVPIALLIMILAETYSLFPQIILQAEERSRGFFQLFFRLFFRVDPYAPFYASLGAVLYAFITITLIYYFFEKTQSPEIIFIALFTLSFSVEALRVSLPYIIKQELPQTYLLISARILLTGRLFGLFSLFIAGVYASGLEFQKHGNIILIIAAIALTIASSVPIDPRVWDTSASVIPGYAPMFSFVEIGISLITVLSFFIAAYTKGSNEYTITAIGILLLLFGRDALLHGDTWASLPLAVPSLVTGTWMINTRLHQYYLWL